MSAADKAFREWLLRLMRSETVPRRTPYPVGVEARSGRLDQPTLYFQSREDAAAFAAQNPSEVLDVVVDNQGNHMVRLRGKEAELRGERAFVWNNLDRVPDTGGGEMGSMEVVTPDMRPTRNDTLHGLGVFGAGAAGGGAIAAANERGRERNARRDERLLRRALRDLMREEYEL